MRLDATCLRYLTTTDLRVLTAIELGMRNHELVPIPLISTLAGLPHGGHMRGLKVVHKHKLVHKETRRYVGYRLTPLGYDMLALFALTKRGVVEGLGRKVGVGKEADVWEGQMGEGLIEEVGDQDWGGRVAVKLHRLGRTSFRSVRNRRDYMNGRKGGSWMYVSRLAAEKEFGFLCALWEKGFPVPRPLGWNRHVVVMEMCEGELLNTVADMDEKRKVLKGLIDVLARLRDVGLVHCDLNEFNIIVGEDGKFWIIDFPQMVSVRHESAQEWFERDLNGILRFFQARWGIGSDDIDVPEWDEGVEEERLDRVLEASGWKGGSKEDDVEENEEKEEHKQEEEEEIPQPAVIMDSGIDKRLIEDRVRRQRGNRKKRQQMARKNVIKDSEKRKIGNEMRSGLWA